MTKIDRMASRTRPAFAVFAVAGASLLAIGAKGTGGVNVWPVVGIVAVLLVAFIASRLVRGDPYYDQHASRDRRDNGAIPWSDGGDGV